LILSVGAIAVLVASAWGQLVPISDVRENNANGVPLDSGQTALITGIFTATSQFGGSGPAFIQDNTAGVAVYGSAVAGFAVGDSVIVSGKVDFYNGLTELKTPTITFVSSGHDVAPRVLTIAHMGDTLNNREVYEGQLALVRGLFDTTGVFQGNRSYPFKDASGPGTVYIDSSVNDILGKPIPHETIDVTGCVSQYDKTAPFFSGYQLMPRSYSDLGGSSGSSIMTIADALVDADSNTVPDLLDSVVTVAGIVTMPSGVSSRTKTDIFIQDRTAGVNIYDPSIYRVLKLGDSLIVSGQVTVYRGKPELTSPQITRADSNHAVPAPAVVTCREMDKTRHRLGSLIAIPGVTASGLVVAGGPNTVFDTSGSGNMYVSYTSEVPGFVMVPDTFTVIGIKSQYGPSSPPYNTGYELIPRFRSDFSRGLESELPLLSIGQVQQPGADGYSSKYEGQYVKVKGRVTGPNSIFTSGSSQSFYVQDATNGVNIYAPVFDSIAGLLTDTLGVEFGCIGKVTEYNGLTELASGVIWVTDSNRVPVPPVELQFNDFLTEGMESKLVRVSGDVITPPAAAGGGTNFTIKNGNPGIAVRAVDGAGIPLSWVRVGRRVNCTGVVGQYSSTPPFGSGYQLMLRFPSDLDSMPGVTAGAKMRIEDLSPQVFNPHAGQVCAIKLVSPTDRKLYLEVFDLEGREVRSNLLVNAPGHDYSYEANGLCWDGSNDNGEVQPIGTYILNLKGVLDNGKTEVQRRLVVLGTRLK
jgi:hypothetical protein